MSLATWKAEFYPIPARRVSKKNALAHSLRKWQGLTKAALRRHGITRNGYQISGEGGRLDIDSGTCALCGHFLKYEPGDYECANCPLAIVRGGMRCDHEMAFEESAPWCAFSEDGDARPMISWLKKAIKAQEREP
jgi:hypothetical protein